MAKVAILGSYANSLINFRGRLIQDLVGRGHEVFACAPAGSQQLEIDLKKLGATYCRIPLERTGMNPLRDTISLLGLWRFFRKQRPDVVISYTIKPVIYGSLAAGLGGVPTVTSIITGLGYMFSGQGKKRAFLEKFGLFLYRIGLRNNQVVFFQNPDDLKFFQGSGVTNRRSRLVLINGSGIDLDHFSPHPLPKEISFLLIARLIREKGIREYVLAAQALKKSFPAVKFRLVGSIDSTPSAILPEQLHGWERDGTIEYYGQLDDVRAALRESAVYVLPSYREGTPRSVLEAMATGRPIITTDVPGCRETVEHGRNGFLVPLQNVSQLAAAMEIFVNQPDLATTMGAESRKIAENKFDVRLVNQTILKNLELVA
ncbi:MAG: glycosyltransferase family 4 protein [Deltaproteobacteria bacterium]|nr:glycosyltransferase family 4 protein [Deltaproteobacteria bacterium]